MSGDPGSVDEPRIETCGPDGLRARWWGPGDAETHVICIHGLTSNGEFFRPLARHAPPGLAIVAPDLRGRGLNETAAVARGIDGHAADVLALIDELETDTILVGHSLGATIALEVERLLGRTNVATLLVDGGPPFPIGSSTDESDVLRATFGASVARIDQTWPDRESFIDWWRAIPALEHVDDHDIVAIALAEAGEGAGGEIRPRLDRTAIETDAHDLLREQRYRALLDEAHRPVTLFCAGHGTDPTGPALFPPDELTRHRRHDVRFITGANHYDILLASTHAALIADRVAQLAREED